MTTRRYLGEFERAVVEIAHSMQAESRVVDAWGVQGTYNDFSVQIVGVHDRETIQLIYRQDGSFLRTTRIVVGESSLYSRDIQVIYPTEILMTHFQLPDLYFRLIHDNHEGGLESFDIIIVQDTRPYAYLYPLFFSGFEGSRNFEDYTMSLVERDVQYLVEGPSTRRILELTIPNAEALSDDELGKISQFENLQVLKITNSPLIAIPAAWKTLKYLRSITLVDCPHLRGGLEHIEQARRIELIRCLAFPQR